MADVFVSYARDDRVRASHLAEALRAQGWDVWWDRNIPPGQDFATYIQQQLDKARCVVVLWSMSSIASEYVRDEASDAKERNVLVPVIIDRVRPPLGFRQRQGADLADWNGDVHDTEFVALVDAIGRLVPRDPKAHETPAIPPGAPQRSTIDSEGNSGSASRLGAVPPLVANHHEPVTPEPAGARRAVRKPAVREGAGAGAFSRRGYLIVGGVLVLGLAAIGIWQFETGWEPSSRTYREVTVEVKFGWGENAVRVPARALYGTSDFYRRVKPTLVVGHMFRQEELSANPPTSPNVVLLNDRFWRETLRSDTSLVNATMYLKDYAFKVLGVVRLTGRWDSVDVLFPQKADVAPVLLSDKSDPARIAHALVARRGGAKTPDDRWHFRAFYPKVRHPEPAHESVTPGADDRAHFCGTCRSSAMDNPAYGRRDFACCRESL